MRLESGELWFVDTKLKIEVKPRQPVATARQSEAAGLKAARVCHKD